MPREIFLLYGVYTSILALLQRFLMSWGDSEWVPTFDLQFDVVRQSLRHQGVMTLYQASHVVVDNGTVGNA